MTDAIPQIAKHNYRLCAVATFLEEAPQEIVARYRRDCIGRGPFIIWDPASDADGFMLCANSIAQLNAGFIEFFTGSIFDDQGNEIPA